MKWPAEPLRNSLRGRLTIALAIAVTILWLAGTGAAGLILRTEIDEVFDSALQEVAQRVLPLAYIELLNRDNDPSEDSRALRVPSVGPHKEYITYVVRDRDGRVLLHSHDADLSTFPDELRPGFADSPYGRVYTEPGVRNTLFVTTAELQGHRQSALIEAVRMLVWPLAALIPISILGLWILVGYSLRPVLALQADIEARGRGNLSPVHAAALPAEIGPVAEAVNRLIARLRRALDAERAFTANSAHELRTPIAAALAQTQRLLSELADGPTRERARSVEVALRQLARVSEKLLQLAKAEGGGLLADQPVDLVQVLRFVLSDIGHDRDAAGRLEIAIAPDATLDSYMDADAFAILARNLIENALKHAPDDTPVSVSLSADARFSVANGGPVVPPSVLVRLTRPFERGASGAAGSGLGLAIAEAISTGAGARLELLSPIPGKSDGFEARLDLSATRARPSVPRRPA